jgi:hypothetical protein
MIGWGVTAPHIGEIYGSGSFFFPVTSRASAQPTPSAGAPHIIHQSTHSGQGGAFWGSHRYVSSHGGVIPQKPLILGTSMGVPSLNVYVRISAQEKHITTLDSSKCASRQDTQCAIVKIKGWGHYRGQTYKSFFQRQIYSQISKHTRKC